MKNIIIAPTDFSDVSVNAVQYAADMAVNIDALLMLMHVNEYVYAYSDAGVVDGIIDENNDGKLEDLARQLSERCGDKLQIKTYLPTGNFDDELMQVCYNLKPFAVVMGTHNELGALSRFLLNSHSLNAARQLHCPVMIIPAHTQWKKPAAICFASDLKDVYDIPAEQVNTIRDTFNADLHIVHVSKNKMHVDRDAVAYLLIQPSLLLNDTKLHIIENTDMLQGLKTFVKEHEIDLVILQAKDYGIVGNLFHKSQSKRMILRPEIPLIVVH